MKTFRLPSRSSDKNYLVGLLLSVLAVIITLLACSHPAQRQPAASGAAAPSETGSLTSAEARIVERGQDFAVYESVTTGTDLLGANLLKTNRITLLQNGMHYFENAGSQARTDSKVFLRVAQLRATVPSKPSSVSDSTRPLFSILKPQAVSVCGVASAPFN